jgi:dTDP-4-dehydrorhamnose reductase
MNIAVLGSNGMAGSMVYKLIRKLYGDAVVGVNRNNFFLVGGEDSRTVRDKLRHAGVDDNSLVINCIGAIPQRPHYPNDMRAYVNSVFPCVLYNQYDNLIHISTNCVFGSLDTWHRPEDSIALPDSEYGSQKRQGELNMPNALILRTSLIGPSPSGYGLFEWALKPRKYEAIEGYLNHYWNGITTLELAEYLMHFMPQCMREDGLTQTGIKHLHSPNVVSKYELLLMIKKIFGGTTPILPKLMPNPCYRLLTTEDRNTRFFPIHEQLLKLRRYLIG